MVAKRHPGQFPAVDGFADRRIVEWHAREQQAIAPATAASNGKSTPRRHRATASAARTARQSPNPLPRPSWPRSPAASPGPPLAHRSAFATSWPTFAACGSAGAAGNPVPPPRPSWPRGPASSLGPPQAFRGAVAASWPTFAARGSAGAAGNPLRQAPREPPFPPPRPSWPRGPASSLGPPQAYRGAVAARWPTFAASGSAGAAGTTA
jgi:hypothetical protein